MFLHIALIHLGRGGEAGPQRVAPQNRCSRWLSERLPRTPAARAAFLTRRATSWSCSRSGPTSLPLPVTRRKRGPLAILANLIQVSVATTGQVASEEPRPTSTSRHPVLPRKVISRPLSEDFNPAASVLCLVACKVKASDFRTTQTTGKADQQHGPVAHTAQGPPVQCLKHRDQVFRQQRLFLTRRRGVAVADAGHDSGDGAILAIEHHAALGTVPADGSQAPLDG